MPRVPLVSGAYQARSLIAGAQKCINLYPESNQGDQQAPVPVTHYPTPGLTLFATLPEIANARGAYRATTGDLYVAAGPTLYRIDINAIVTVIGTIADMGTPVSMSDNGLCLVLVDGTTTGYVVDLTQTNGTYPFALITDPNFLGADKVDYLDTYFLFNNPGTTQFYISLSEASFAMMTTTTTTVVTPLNGSPTTTMVPVPKGTPPETSTSTAANGTVTTVTTAIGVAFDPLDIAGKVGSADDLVSLIVVHGQLFLIGALTTEPWYNSGSADFTFSATPGAFIEHGCAAKFSVARQDVSAFWLSQDREGHCVVVQAQGYGVSRISTHAIEALFQGYARIDDAVGFCYQQQGHAFYIITFPSADATWAYELATGQWHELAWLDGNGKLHRHRAGACAHAYGLNLIADWQTGTIYVLDPAAQDDAGNPILRVRTFPHMIADGKRVSYQSFIADMQTGTMPSTENANNDLVSLRWSDDHGSTFGNFITQSIGQTGAYSTSLKFNRLGMGRDRVFELSWSAPLPTALNGAFLEMQEHGS